MVEASTVKKIFKVEGMSCSSCAMTIQKKLNSLEGVINTHVNVATDGFLSSKLLGEASTRLHTFDARGRRATV